MKSQVSYSQKIAYVDLSRGTVDMEVIPLEWRRKFLGARGINMYLLSRLTRADMDPLGPDNPFMVGLGLLTGSLGFGTSRYNITGLSPSTGPSKDRGNVGDAAIGGHFGHEMKHAGFDHLVITGQSPTPVYLLISNDHIEIRDARRLWGMDTWETQKAIWREHGDERMRALCIGPAGENLVRQACVITGPKDAAGGSGMGAVMGSKKLKAIAARGSKDITVAYPSELLGYMKEQQDLLMTRKFIKALGRLGTPLLLASALTRGFGIGDPKLSVERRQASGNLVAENILPYTVGMSACAGCAVHCRHRHLVTEGRYAGTRGEGPENGAVGGLGNGLRNHNMEAVLYLNNLCNGLGLTAGVGSSVGWAMGLYEEGIINDEMVGYPLKWGDVAAIESMIKDIAYRQGFGDVLADGKFALERLPPKAAENVGFIKGAMARGTESGLHAVREFVFGQLVSSLPAHVHRSRTGNGILGLPDEVLQKLYDGHRVASDMHSYEGKAYMTYYHEILYAIFDSLGCCRFQTLQNSPNCPKWEEYSQLIRLTTGLDMPEPYLRELGERIYTLERMLLWRFGYGDREHDRLPKEMVHSPEDEEARNKFDEMLDEYYELHGWDGNGRPRPENLKRLGLSAEVMA